jgi:hypothetical protein
MQPVVDDAERRSVERYLVAVTRDAQYMADTVADFLEAQGIRPRQNRSGDSCALPQKGETTTPVHAFLLNLAAALRIAMWERAGLRSELPADLPSSREAFQNLVPAESFHSSTGSSATPALAQTVFRTWLEQFSRSSRATLGTDVLLDAAGLSEDELLDALADFLYENRNLADMKEE